MSAPLKPATKLTVGLVLDDSLDKPDGVQQYVLTIGRWLADRGHDVHYLVGQTTRRDRPGIHSLSRNVGVRFNQNRMSIPLPVADRRVREVLAEIKPDVLHVQMPYSPMLAARLIKQAAPATAVVGTFHIMPYSGLERAGSRLLATLLRPTLRRYDDIVSVSPAAQAFAAQVFGIESSVLPNAVPVDDFRVVPPPRDAQRPVIVFLGRLVERKGAAHLLHAVKRLSEIYDQDFKVLIGGKGPQADELQALSRQLAIADRVEFVGFVSEADKPAFLAQADVAVFPSTGGESFGIVLVEAMAAGSGVVVGGNNPGYASVLAECPEALIDPADTAGFADKLRSLLADKALAAALHARQQKLLTQFDIETVGPRLEAIYRRAIANRSETSHN